MGAPIDTASFRAAMARFPGAVTLVTARTPGGERRGITATAVCSVTADPPSLLVCLNARTGTCAAAWSYAPRPSRPTPTSRPCARSS